MTLPPIVPVEAGLRLERPVLLVVVDTEEEFDWSKPFDRNARTTGSIAEQGRAHEVFARYGVQPTYVVNHAVAVSREVATLRGLVEQGLAGFGTHCHPWITPPHEEAVTNFNSFHGNLPPALEAAKLRSSTEAVAQAFGAAPRVFKAGRYGLGPKTFDSLLELGYCVDCSFVPDTTFAHSHGPDYLGMPAEPFFTDASRRLLEVPLTVGYGGWAWRMGRRLPALWDSPLMQRLHVQGSLSRLNALWRARLSPEGFDAPVQKRLIDAMLAQGHRVFTLTYHSPSLVPGHTPYVRTGADLREFLDRIDIVLRHFRERGGEFSTPLALWARASAAAPVAA
ncbi:polysaccharide deacetylase family protein [Hydrogenophaga sp. T2]|uniref:polysaccharide deacetylase family protein n=1 Tax=Hydrogenophaga sp. T2 TaxID=3132823 RepID=UPI003CEBF878